jgi:hypothetical protein
MRVRLEHRDKRGLRSRRGILICESRGPNFERLLGVDRKGPNAPVESTAHALGLVR